MNAHEKPTRPSPEYAWSPALRQAVADVVVTNGRPRRLGRGAEQRRHEDEDRP
jgi:hypothetical protein